MCPVSFEVLGAPNQPIPLIPLTEVLGNGCWNFLQRCSQPKIIRFVKYIKHRFICELSKGESLKVINRLLGLIAMTRYLLFSIYTSGFQYFDILVMKVEKVK